MTDFRVKVGKTPRANGGSKTPRERKPVHPGLQQIASSVRCLGCKDFLEWSDLSGSMLVSHCGCGLWTRDRKGFYRWIRWSSAPFWPNTGPLYSPERR